MPVIADFRAFAAARTHAALILALLSCLSVAAGAQTAKKPVNSEADLPRYTYSVAGTASALVQADPATFGTFAAQVAADIDKTLDGYDIRDFATLRSLLGEKMQLLALAGKNHEALDLVRRIRALEDKPDARLTSGRRIEAILEARLETGQTSGSAFLAAFEKHYAAAIGALPYGIVGNQLKEAKTGAEIGSPALVLGNVQAGLDPAVEKTHALSGAFAATIVFTRFFDDVLYPTKAPALAVLTGYLAKNTAAARPDIWASRDVSLAGASGLTPVIVAIWDSGTDLSLFPAQSFTDPHPGPHGPHGLGFDLLGFKEDTILFPISPERSKQYPSMLDDLQALSDLQNNIDSPNATALKQKLSTLKPAEAATFFESLEYFGQYVHGTHVAGIAVRDNPAARILVGRLTYDYKTIPTAPTDEIVKRGDDDTAEYVDYFKAHGVRVVNMSWGGSASGYEDALEKNGLGKDAATRKQLAQRWFAWDKKALDAAIASAPNILFIASAGNSNSDATFDETIPASLRHPNLLTVGAVDQAGDATSFTSYGPTVRAYADGYHVESTVPGGRTIQLSGTSMSAPNVANLAAKLIALDPSLTPEQTIDLIVRGATLSNDGKRPLIDPKRSVELLRARAAAQSK